MSRQNTDPGSGEPDGIRTKLETLPFDVHDLLADFLSYNQLVNLSLTCKSLLFYQNILFKKYTIKNGVLPSNPKKISPNIEIIETRCMVGYPRGFKKCTKSVVLNHRIFPRQA